MAQDIPTEIRIKVDIVSKNIDGLATLQISDNQNTWIDLATFNLSSSEIVCQVKNLTPQKTYYVRVLQGLVISPSFSFVAPNPAGSSIQTLT